jgi:DNA polymerase-3 subunit alpha
MQDAYLRFRAEKGLVERGVSSVEYKERLDFEWKVICQMGFAGYYLVVADYICWAKNQGIEVGPGRGSGAGSLVAYLIGITDIDPIKYNLAFERFLNPYRVSMPDFDVDFSQRRRSEVVDYIARLYGYDKVCSIGTVGTAKSKLAFKDVARTLGVEFAKADEYAKLIPEEKRGGQGEHSVTLNDCLNPSPHFLQEHAEEMKAFRYAYDNDAMFHRIINLAVEIEGIPRSLGVHAAGTIISPTPLADELPLMRKKDSLIAATQFTDKQIEKMGYVKFDFLGLRTLDVIHDAVAAIKESLGIVIDWDKIDDRDPSTFEMLSRGECFSVFQLSESGMTEFTRQFKPETIEDIATISAIYRPGPLDNGMHEAIIRVRAGGEQPKYPPGVSEVLASTDGILTYQEQVLEIAKVLAGYSIGEADLLRRAIGKKIPEEMAAHRTKFVSGAVSRGHNEKEVSQLYDMIEKFADYCFNKSHAVAYAVISFRTAYLKCHYPTFFYAAELSSYDGDLKKIRPVFASMKRMGLEILPPDVNRSSYTYTAEGNMRIRIGLGGIKGLGASLIDSLLEARRSGVFEDLFNFVRRLKPKSNNIEALAWAGALDGLEPDLNRAELISYGQACLESLKTTFDSEKKNQLNLFSAFYQEEKNEGLNIPKAKISISVKELLSNEKEAIGFYASRSPFDSYRDIRDSVLLDDIASLDCEGLRISILGQITEVVVRQGKRGSFAFLNVEDDSGSISVKVWSETFERVRDVLVVDNVVLIVGKTTFFRGLEVQAEAIVLADVYLRQVRKGKEIKSLNFPLMNKLLRFERGSIPVELIVPNFKIRLGSFDLPSDLELR